MGRGAGLGVGCVLAACCPRCACAGTGPRPRRAEAAAPQRRPAVRRARATARAHGLRLPAPAPLSWQGFRLVFSFRENPFFTDAKVCFFYGRTGRACGGCHELVFWPHLLGHWPLEALRRQPASRAASARPASQLMGACSHGAGARRPCAAHTVVPQLVKTYHLADDDDMMLRKIESEPPAPADTHPAGAGASACLRWEGAALGAAARRAACLRPACSLAGPPRHPQPAAWRGRRAAAFLPGLTCVPPAPALPPPPAASGVSWKAGKDVTVKVMKKKAKPGARVLLLVSQLLS